MLLNEFDYIIIALYIAFTLIVGLWPIRKGLAEEFILSGRNLSSSSSGLTIAASKIGAGAIVTYAALFFTYGLGAMWMYAGYIFGYVVFYIFAVKLHKESKLGMYYTLADYFQAHYGKGAAVAMGLTCTLSLSGWVLTNLVAGGKMLSFCLNWPFEIALPIVALVIFLYLFVGGFRAVVRTDVIQYISLLIVLLFIVIVLTTVEHTPTKDLTFSSMRMGTIVSFFVTGLFFPMGSAELWQRVYATKDKRSLAKAIIIASTSFVILIGALSAILFKLAASGAPIGTEDADIGLFRNVSAQLPRGMVGLWFIAFISAIASSADTFIYTTSCSAVIDVWERASEVSKEKRVVRIRVLLAVVVVCGIIGTFVVRNVVDITFIFAGVTMGIGGISLTAWVFPRVPSWGVVTACILANTAATIQALLSGISVTTAVTNLGVALLTIWSSVVVDTAVKRWRNVKTTCRPPSQ